MSASLPDVFPIVPASPKAFWLLAAVCALLVLACAALGYAAYSTRNSRVEVGGDEIRLVGDFWGRAIAIRSLRLDDAQIVDLDAAPEFAPQRRTLGTGLPGYASGWFRLRNGERALTYLTKRQRVLYIPTSLGYVLLLTPDRPEDLLASLRSKPAAAAGAP